MVFEPALNYEVIKEDEYFDKMQDITDIFDRFMARGYFKSFDNTDMYYEYLKVKNPRGNIVIIHGYTEFSRKYYELTWYFANMGFNVFLYDLRSHGNSYRYSSDCQMTHIESFDDYAKDLDCFMKCIVCPNSDEKDIHIFSHSMGATVAALFLENHKNCVKKAVMSSAMIYPVTPNFPPFIIRKLMKNEGKKHGWETGFRFSKRFNPNAQIEKSNDLSVARFEYNLKMRVDNPLYQNSYGSNRWNYEAVSVEKRICAKENLKKINASVLVIVAGKDTAVKVKPQLRFAKKLGCECKMFKESRHSLYTQSGEPLIEYVHSIIEFFCSIHNNTITDEV